MEGDGGRQGLPTPNPHDRSLKRSASDSSLQHSNSHQLLDDVESESSTPVGLVTEEFSSMLAAATSAGELLQRFLRQRTNPPNQHDLLVPRLRGQHDGGSSSTNTDQVGHENLNFWESAGSPPLWRPDLIRNNPDDHVLILLDPALPQGGSGTRIIPQVNDPRLSSRLAWEVRDETAGTVQGSSSRVQYRNLQMTLNQQYSHMFPGHWRLVDVVYVTDEDDENASMRLDIDRMSYYEELVTLGEGIGAVNTGLSQEVITERLRQRKYNRLATGPKFGEESCCICQEGYADDEDVGKLDCEHEYHAACIRQWLEQKNACPVCKKAALSQMMNSIINPHQ